jgi:hypothetical protein
MTNQQAEPPKRWPNTIALNKLATLRNRLLDVVAGGELGVALSREDMLTLAWALSQISDPTQLQAGRLDLPTEASSDSETWRYLPQRALLVPPHAGPDAVELAADAAPGDNLAQYGAWLDRLAVRVRNGECSPEYALLAASFAAERREAERLALK